MASMFSEVSGPSTIGSYNVHNILAGSNILTLGLFCRASGFPKPKTQVIGWGRLYCYAMNKFPNMELGTIVYVLLNACYFTLFIS